MDILTFIVANPIYIYIYIRFVEQLMQIHQLFNEFKK